MSSGNGAPPPGTAEKSLGEIVNEVSEKATLLVREEIELAKAEVTTKATRIGKGVAAFGAAGFIIDSYRHEPDLMKVIIVEVTRAANTFGRHHLGKIREAYDLIAGIVEQARADGSFKSEISADFAAMCFYGAIEQLLTAWIFDVLPQSDEDYERAKDLVVEAICGGLESTSDRAAGVSG